MKKIHPEHKWTWVYYLIIFDLLKHAKAQAVIEERSLTALVEMALDKYLPKEIIIKKAQI